MSHHASRRTFLKSSALGSAGALAAQIGFLHRLPVVSAAEAKMAAGMVRYDAQIEPLVRLIEETDRQRLLEKVGERIQGGTSYQEVLAALLLAAVRNVAPRPAVGFKFHSVLVVNSCHLASLAGPDSERWLPIFWALDYFKSAQAEEAQQSGWHLSAVNDALVPDAAHAEKMFVEAMDNWNEDQADLAIAGLVRHAGATRVFNLLAQYAARDFRAIGHKVIFLANGWRTLQVIGWEHAEPVLRSLVFALMNHQGEPNPASSDLAADRPWREQEPLLKQLADKPTGDKRDDGVTRQLLAGFRTDSAEAAARAASESLSGGISPQSVWDGVFVGAGEVLMRQPGIIGLHGLTTANAMHYVWQQVSDETLRRRLLLQAASFTVLFREAAQGRGKLADLTVDGLLPSQPEASPANVPEILTSVSHDRRKAAQQVAGYLRSGGDPYALIDAARTLIFFKGKNAHDYKFSSAVLEDFGHVSPQWRDRFLALSVFNLKGADDPDNPLAARSHAALA